MCSIWPVVLMSKILYVLQHQKSCTSFAGMQISANTKRLLSPNEYWTQSKCTNMISTNRITYFSFFSSIMPLFSPSFAWISSDFRCFETNFPCDFRCSLSLFNHNSVLFHVVYEFLMLAKHVVHIYLIVFKKYVFYLTSTYPN